MCSSALVGWFADIGLADRLEVGGKGGSLGELVRAGIEVPPGFVVKTAAFERFIEALERESPVRERVESLEAEDLGAMTALSRELRARFAATPLPADVADEIARAAEELGSGAAQSGVAVRSSATTEDAADASFAGLQDTYLWVKSLADPRPDTKLLGKPVFGGIHELSAQTGLHGKERGHGRGRANDGGRANRRSHVHPQSADREIAR